MRPASPPPPPHTLVVRSYVGAEVEEEDLEGFDKDEGGVDEDGELIRRSDEVIDDLEDHIPHRTLHLFNL